jgi:hypothetical protein
MMKSDATKPSGILTRLYAFFSRNAKSEEPKKINKNSSQQIEAQSASMHHRCTHIGAINIIINDGADKDDQYTKLERDQRSVDIDLEIRNMERRLQEADQARAERVALERRVSALERKEKAKQERLAEKAKIEARLAEMVARDKAKLDAKIAASEMEAASSTIVIKEHPRSTKAPETQGFTLSASSSAPASPPRKKRSIYSYPNWYVQRSIQQAKDEQRNMWRFTVDGTPPRRKSPGDTYNTWSSSRRKAEPSRTRVSKLRVCV